MTYRKTPDRGLLSPQQMAQVPIHSSRRTSTVLSLLATAFFVLFLLQFMVFNKNWQWDVVLSYLFSDRILLGLWNTILLTILSTVVGLLLGILTAAARLSDFWLLRLVASGYIWITRATPLLVLLLMVFFLAALTPTLGFGIPFFPPVFEVSTNEVITRFSASIIALSLYLGGKAAEVIRSGVKAVPSGQFEACHALGLSPWQRYSKVIGPQAIRVLIPPMANEVITMFKNTSLLAVIGYMELLTTVQMIYARNFQTIPLLTVAVLWYLVLTSIAMYGQGHLERRYGRGFDRRTNITQVAEPTKTGMLMEGVSK